VVRGGHNKKGDRRNDTHERFWVEMLGKKRREITVRK
jgi:hypothetical protein